MIDRSLPEQWSDQCVWLRAGGDAIAPMSTTDCRTEHLRRHPHGRHRRLAGGCVTDDNVLYCSSGLVDDLPVGRTREDRGGSTLAVELLDIGDYSEVSAVDRHSRQPARWASGAAWAGRARTSKCGPVCGGCVNGRNWKGSWSRGSGANRHRQPAKASRRGACRCQGTRGEDRIPVFDVEMALAIRPVHKSTCGIARCRYSPMARGTKSHDHPARYG